MTDRDQIIQAFIALLPKHEASLSLIHNQHRDYYETVEEYLANTDPEDVVDRDAMIASGSVWQLQVYPNSPVGFYVIYASTLEGIFQRLACEVRDE